MVTSKIVVLAVLLALFSDETTAGVSSGLTSGGYESDHVNTLTYETGPAVAGQDGGARSFEHGGHESVDYVAYPKYDFAYGVTDPYTGDTKAQKESRDGHHVVGEYELKEPGGNVRTVKYSSDKNGGFTAHVINNGGNDHPGAHGHSDGFSIANFHGPVSGPSYPIPVNGGH